MKVSLIIPAYNEEERISPTLASYLDYFSNNFTNFEILVVVEGMDKTLNIVKEFAKKDNRVRWLYSKNRLGKGGAVLNGFSLIDGDYVGFVDADGSTKPEVFIQMFDFLKIYHGVIASRKLKDSKLIKKEPLLQRIGSIGFNALVRCLFLMPFKDTQCGAKVFRREAINAILPKLTLANFAFDIDLLYVLHKLGFKIIEIPTVWEYKTGAAFNFTKWFWKLAPNMFLSIIRLRLVHSRFSSLVKLYDTYEKISSWHKNSKYF